MSHNFLARPNIFGEFCEMQNRLRSHVPLQDRFTFGVPATARWWVEIHSEKQALELLADNQFGQQPLHLLGGGSNILPIGDLPGIVVQVAIKGIEIWRETDTHIWLQVGAGENWHELVRHCLEQDWGGLENLSLIPGCVGAAPIQNIGAYGVELEQVFEGLEALQLSTGTSRWFDHQACEFGYRDSIFKRRLQGQYLITRVILRLTKTNHPLHTSYGAIETELAQAQLPRSIQGISQAVCQIRSSKLPDPAQIGNGGSFFKNPVLSPIQFARIRRDHPLLPHYPQADGSQKLPAAWLIDQCGWKGYRKGDAGVHQRQALVLVNHGQASGSEILALSQRIQASVQDRFGIQLEREINVWP
jgi:UDP-N-acetylmuramate dehydrogenase